MQVKRPQVEDDDPHVDASSPTAARPAQFLPPPSRPTLVSEGSPKANPSGQGAFRSFFGSTKKTRESDSSDTSRSDASRRRSGSSAVWRAVKSVLGFSKRKSSHSITGSGGSESDDGNQSDSSLSSWGSISGGRGDSSRSNLKDDSASTAPVAAVSSTSKGSDWAKRAGSLDQQLLPSPSLGIAMVRGKLMGGINDEVESVRSNNSSGT